MLEPLGRTARTAFIASTGGRMNDAARAASLVVRRRKTVEREEAAQRAELDDMRAQRRHARDPRVKLYRAEKRRRAARPDPRMVEAAACLARLYDDLADHGKGGRPKRKHGPGIFIPSRSGPGSRRDE